MIPGVDFWLSLPDPLKGDGRGSRWGHPGSTRGGPVGALFVQWEETSSGRHRGLGRGRLAPGGTQVLATNSIFFYFLGVENL